MNKVACKVCGASILVTTAMRNNGHCVPCSNGTRTSIEEGRRRNLEQRELNKNPSPPSIYWSTLIDRVHNTEGGFEALPDVEKKYFAACCLEGELYNGGFDQFFSNSAGSYYEHALAALSEMGATESMQLLMRAKQVLFDFSAVPTDTSNRRAFLRNNSSRSRDARLDELDRLFRAYPDSLLERIEKFAMAHKLYEPHKPPRAT
jgi:hypothetical protein